MAEYFILFVTDRVDAVYEFHVLGKDRADREGVNSCAAGFLFFQSRASCDGIVYRHVLKSVHFLIIGAQSHEEQTCQRHMILLAEIHQPLCWLLLQMEDIKSGCGVVRSIKRSAQFRIFKHFPCGFQFICSVDAIVDRLSLFDLFLEEGYVPLLRLASGLIGQIFLELLNIGAHFFRIWNAFVFCAAVKFDNIFQEADQRLRVHCHMLAKEIDSVKSIRHFNHYHAGHLRILHFERNPGPLPHLRFRFFQGSV